MPVLAGHELPVARGEGLPVRRAFETRPQLAQPRFTAAYPEVQLEVSVSNRNVDFVEEGFDLAIRLGPGRRQAVPRS